MPSVYLIRNVTNGKGYVGKTIKDPKQRFAEHKSNARRGANSALYSAMRKHGIENFTIRKIAACTPEILNALESYFIVFYGTRAGQGHGYNLSDGGEGQSGLIHSQETRLKMSIARKGKKHSPRSPEHSEKLAVINRGRKFSDAVRLKLSTMRKGKKKSPEHVAKILESRKCNKIKRMGG